MTLFGKGLVLAAQARGAELDYHGRPSHLREAQERALSRLLKRAKDTQFGRAYRFERLTSARKFTRNVPVHRYADLKPWFERALAGEADVTWPGQIPYFGMTSGTTAGNKYLPISMDSVRQQRRGGFDPLAAYLRWTRDSQVLGGKAILLGGSTTLERNGAGRLVGDNTGIMALHMPRIVQRNYLPHAPTRALIDWDEKLDAVVHESLHADVRLLAGTPSWFSGLFERLLRAARDEGREVDDIHDIWPNLRLITGGGVNFAPYRSLLRSYMGRHVPYVDVYNATEGGIMGVQDQPDEPGMRLLPDNGLFYEFIPLEDLESPNPRRVPAWEVEEGGVYAVVVSTMSGIFSYMVGDCLRFVQTYPHRFIFEGRTAAFLNVVGEHVSQGELERAAKETCRRLDLRLRDFTVTAEVGVGDDGAVRHVWLMEFDDHDVDVERCAQLIDEEVGRGNEDYRVHRSSLSGLLAPQVIPLRAGAFELWMRERGKLGGQNKIPRVLPNPEERANLIALRSYPISQPPPPPAL